MIRVSTVERAFQLAGSGECTTVEAIQRRLEREDYTQAASHLGGLLIRKQLREAIARAKRAGLHDIAADAKTAAPAAAVSPDTPLA